MATFFQRLMTQTESRRQELLTIPAITRGVVGDIPLGTYTAFLTQAYHHVKHTVPLLMACGSRLPMEKEWLREAIAEYIEEETGHQEWILDDLTACGINSTPIRNEAAHETTELMIAYVYDYIQRQNPVGFFGMVLVLEGTSIQLASTGAKAIQDKLQLPDKAFSYLTSHGALDIGHMQFFEKLMNRITDKNDQQAIINVANMVYRLYGNIFRALPLNYSTADQCA